MIDQELNLTSKAQFFYTAAPIYGGKGNDIYLKFIARLGFQEGSDAGDFLWRQGLASTEFYSYRVEADLTDTKLSELNNFQKLITSYESWGRRGRMDRFL
jgi:hypothetical protein